MHDFQEALLLDGVASGLKHGSDFGGFADGELTELCRVVVIKDNVSTENLLDGVEGVFGDGGDGGVVEGEDGDGIAGVDLFVEVGFGEIIVESSEFRELTEELCDVEGGNRGGETEEEEQRKEGEREDRRRGLLLIVHHPYF